MRTNKEKYKVRSSSRFDKKAKEPLEVIKYRNNPFITNDNDLYLAPFIKNIAWTMLCISFLLMIVNLMYIEVSLNKIVFITFALTITLGLIFTIIEFLEDINNTYYKVPFISHKLVAKTSKQIYIEDITRIKELLEDSNFEKETIDAINSANDMSLYKFQDVIASLYKAKKSQDSYINEILNNDMPPAKDEMSNKQYSFFINLWSAEQRKQNKTNKKKAKEQRRKEIATQKAEQIIETMNIRSNGYKELKSQNKKYSQQRLNKI